MATLVEPILLYRGWAQVRANWAREMAWITAERTRLDQCLGRRNSGLGVLPGIRTSKGNSQMIGAGL